MEECTNPTLEQIYHEYDKVIAETMARMIGCCLESKRINLFDFDRKNPEHLYLFHIAMLINNIYGYDIMVEASKWNVFCLNWKYRKSVKKIKRIKNLPTDGIFIPDFLKLCHPVDNKILDENFSFAEIYKAYYERKK